MSILFLIAAAAAGSAGAADVNPPTRVKSDQDKMVCKSERFVGSNMSTRICKPRSEWDQAKKDAQKALDRRLLRVDRPPPIEQ